ncbi:MAG: hypothetical protein M5R36_02960 [Deltaproteobacteria bacterium]|nr:hypothetical protein [Deltaproteobacteria bacterium]
MGTFPRTLVFQYLFAATGGALVAGGVTTFQVVVGSVVFAVVALGTASYIAKRRGRRV